MTHLCRSGRDGARPSHANAQDAQVLANYARHRQQALSPLLVPEL